MKSISNKRIQMFDGDATFRIDATSASAVIDDDGSLTLYVPDVKDNNLVPEHIQALTAMALYFSEHYDQVMNWYGSKMNYVN